MTFASVRCVSFSACCKTSVRVVCPLVKPDQVQHLYRTEAVVCTKRSEAFLSKTGVVHEGTSDVFSYASTGLGISEIDVQSRRPALRGYRGSAPYARTARSRLRALR